MKIQNVTDASFRKYGKVLEGYDFSALLKEMKHTPLRHPVNWRSRQKDAVFIIMLLRKA